MRDVLLTLCGIKSIAPDLNPMVEISLSGRSNGEIFVQLVNNSGCFGLSFFDPVPMYGCRLEIPSEQEPKAVNSLKAGKSIPYEYRNSVIHVELKELKEYEAITISF